MRARGFTTKRGIGDESPLSIFRASAGSKAVRGFTLIELLVVIAIIGVLSSIILGSLSSARVKARDAKRMTDLTQMQRALELYRSKYNAYPVGAAGSDRSCWVNNEAYSACHPLGALKTESLLSRVPYDPGRNAYVGTGCGGAQFYAYWSDGRSYLIGAVNESRGSTGCTQTGNWGGPNASNYTYQFYVRSPL